mmetsp:Transcript_18981/g.47319  ORF Transcript_18981/g.47319 Transcript_18981/m.47319 type:complete len:169 (+) Transcript_18981:144-650(+)
MSHDCFQTVLLAICVPVRPCITENEMYDPTTDPELAKRHPQEDDPYYWRKLKVVHPVFQSDPESKTSKIISMMMTHPGLPAYLPGNKKPADKTHAIAFEDKKDAERFVWLMRATRARGGSEGIATTSPMPPKAFEKFAVDSGDLGGAAQVDFPRPRVCTLDPAFAFND